MDVTWQFTQWNTGSGKKPDDEAQDNQSDACKNKPFRKIHFKLKYQNMGKICFSNLFSSLSKPFLGTAKWFLKI